MMFIAVDLPEPDAPTTARKVPAWMTPGRPPRSAWTVTSPTT